MPPTVQDRTNRLMQMLAAPQNQVKTLGQQQQGGVIVVNSADGDWEFSPGDIGRCVEGTSSSAQTFMLRLSTDASGPGPFPINAVIEVFQAGTGPITIAGQSGVTLLIPPGYTATTAGQNATIGLRQRALDEWVLNGFLGT